MEPTPIFTDLVATEPARSGARSGAHGEGRSVTDLLRALREEAPRKPTRTPARAHRKRLDRKRMRGEKKRLRRPPRIED